MGSTEVAIVGAEDSSGSRDNDDRGQLKERGEYFHQTNKKYIFQIKAIMSQILFDKRILF